MAAFIQHKELTIATVCLLSLSILCKFITGLFLNSLIRESENMSSTENRILKQCKSKFKNSYKLNDGVPNIPVYVDKFLNKMQIGRFSVDGISHFSGQLMLLSVFFSGAGACKGIIDGETLGEILPFYLMAFLGLYLYFSISSLVDAAGKKEVLKTSLIDYLENHMAVRLSLLDESIAMMEEKNGKSGTGVKEPEADSGEPEGRNIQRDWEFAMDMSSEETPLKTIVLRSEEQEAESKGSLDTAAARGAVKTARRAKARSLLMGGTQKAEDVTPAEQSTREQLFTKNQEKELEELLREYLA